MKKNHVEMMVARMQLSGYSMKFRSEVVDSAIKAYREIQRAVRVGDRPMHRPRAWRAEEREKARIEKRKSGYTTGGHDSVIFLPTTPGSELKRSLQQEIDMSGFKIKVVEKVGKTVKQQLQRSDPFRGEGCMRGDCTV